MLPTNKQVTTDAAQADVELEIEERQYSEFALRDNPELEKALLRIGIRKVSTEYSVPDFGRIVIAGSEVATGEFTSVELKVVEAGSKEAAQACKYLAFQERMKGTGKSGRVVLIAPSFNITFWSVAERFPEIQAFSYTQDATEAIALTRESHGRILTLPSFDRDEFCTNLARNGRTAELFEE